MFVIENAEVCLPGEYTRLKPEHLQAEELLKGVACMAMLALQGAIYTDLAIKCLAEITHDTVPATYGHGYFTVRFTIDAESLDTVDYSAALSPNGFIKPNDPLRFQGIELPTGYFIPRTTA
jgi:hypothetical protein